MPKTHPFRRTMRELLAASFWFHALCVSHIVRIPPMALSASTIHALYNGTIIAFIFYYSYFAEYGWWSVLFDCTCVVLWPFITFFRLIGQVSKAFCRYIRKRAVLAPIKLITVPSAEPKIVPVADGGHVTVSEAVKKVRESAKARPMNWLQAAARPVQQFAFLWALLLLTLNNRFLIYVACAIALAGAYRAIVSLWSLVSSTSKGLQRIKDGLSAQLKLKIQEVLIWEGAWNREIANAVNGLRIFELVFAFIDENRPLLAQCASFVAAMVTIPFYLYVSFLFASVYYGLAHVVALPLSRVEAMLDSLFVPFAYTDLPHQAAIRLVAGLQAVAFTVMGWNIFFRQLTSRLDGIATTAAELRTTFNETGYHRKAEMLFELAAQHPVEPTRKPPSVKTIAIQNRSARRKKLKSMGRAIDQT